MIRTFEWMLVWFSALFATLLLIMFGKSASFRRCVQLPTSFQCWMCTTKGTRYIENISSVTNSKVKLLKSLALKKKRGELELVLVEGQRVILDALESGAVPKHVMYTDRTFDSPLGDRLDKAFAQLPADCTVSKVSDSVLSSISETVTDQGVVAAFHQSVSDHNRVHTVISEQRSLLLLALDGIRDPGNMGTLLRTAYGLGADAIACVESCDIWSPKVVRSSTGVQLTATNTMPIVEYKDWQLLYESLRYREAVCSGQNSRNGLVGELGGAQDKKGRGESSSGTSSGGAMHPMQIVIADGSEDSIPYTEVDFTQPSLVVVGSEAQGVSAAARQAPGTVIHVRIPLLRRLESFNAAVAGSILLAEAVRQRGNVGGR